MASRLLARARHLSSRSSSEDTKLRDTGEVEPEGMKVENRQDGLREFHVEFEKIPELPESLLIRPSGKLGANRIITLNQKILENLQDTDTILLVDFSLVEELASSAIGLLVALKNRIRARGGELVLLGMRPRFLRMLDIFGFQEYFSIALDLNHAVEYIVGMKRDTYPISVVCPSCSTPLGIEKPGRGRCRVCDAVLTALPDGSLELG
jgi:anti-anti-sigma factor